MILNLSRTAIPVEGAPRVRKLVRVLVIEDDAVIGRALAQGLQEAGHQCDLAASGKVGLGRAQLQLTDVIVLDLALPELDGMTLLRQIRNQGIDTPVLILTSLGSVE